MTTSSALSVLTQENNMLNYRDIESYKLSMIRTLNERGYLATRVTLAGNSWIALVRGEGWRPVNDLLTGKPTRVPVDNDFITSVI
jgi:hypothetical protein